MKKVNIVLSTIIIILIVFLSYCFIPHKVNSNKTDENIDMSLTISNDQSTGVCTAIKYDKDRQKIKDLLSSKYPNIKCIYIKLDGDLPYSKVSDPSYIDDIVVYGSLIGTAHDEGDNSTIPEFNVSYYTTNIAPIFDDRNPISKFLLPILILPLITVILIIILIIRVLKDICRKINNNKQKKKS